MAPNLAKKAGLILQASGQAGMYGSHRVVAAIYNSMFGTEWTKDIPTTEEGRAAQVYVRSHIKFNLPQPRSNQYKDWSDMKKYGIKASSILEELENKKTGAKVKELYEKIS